MIFLDKEQAKRLHRKLLAQTGGSDGGHLSSQDKHIDFIAKEVKIIPLGRPAAEANVWNI
jgi:hypothetical protein